MVCNSFTSYQNSKTMRNSKQKKNNTNIKQFEYDRAAQKPKQCEYSALTSEK